MNKMIILVLSICFALTLSANNGLPKNSLSINLGGPGALTTFEYEHKLNGGKKSGFSLTAGVGSAGVFFSFPVGFNYTYGDKNQLLLGAHFVPLAVYNDFWGSFSTSGTDWSVSYAISPRFGYRRLINGQKNSSYLSVYFSPLFVFGGGFFPSAGLGLGLYL